MNSLVVALVLVLIGKSLAGEVADKFRSAKLVDDLVEKPPDSMLDVEFDCGFIKLGNKFTPLQVRNRPKVTWKDAKESEFYTLILVDALGKGREWLHWLGANIPGNNIDKGAFPVSFFPSAPPKDSGEHRYVFLLYKQPGKLDLQGQQRISTFQMEGRDNFPIKAFVDKFKLGSPIAGNFYLASWDESCNELNKLIEENAKKY